ncbi:MAG: restriction endonuclease subunit S [Desulfobacterales bacterium]|nr:restriction endonuclease subunit S [Desulfobacterales bacterium]
MMEGWKEYRLGDVIEINSESIGRNYKFKKINYFDISSVKSGYVEKINTIDLKNAPSRAKRIVRKKDTILSTVRPSNRSFFYFKEAKENDIASTGFAVLRPKQELDDRYLYYLVTDYSFTGFLVSNEKGATYPAVTTDVIERAKIHLPPLRTQHKIAKILSAYDDLIENNLKRIKLLEEMAQITYEEWFVRIKFPGHEKAVFDKETGLPEGWKQVELGDVVELVKNSVLPKDVSWDTPYIGLEHMPRKSISLSNWQTSEKVGSLKFLYQKSDILFGKIRPYFHKVGVTFNHGITSTDTFVLRPINQMMHGIILQTVFSESFVSAATQSSNGTKMPRANWNVLKKYQVIVSQIELQAEYQKISQDVLNMIGNILIQNQRLKESRDILLPRLMTGMIDVEKLDIE